MTTKEIAQLSDDSLITATAAAASAERTATVELIQLLMELDRRRLYLGRGYSSLFTFCTRSLRLSEHAAYNRITAARSARRFPRLVDELIHGDLTLSSIGLLAPHLTEETVDALVEGARGKSTREVERMIAGVHLQPDMSPVLRALPAPKPLGQTDEIGSHARTIAVAGCAASETAASAPCAVGNTPAASRSSVAPLGTRRYLLKVTISEDTHDKLRQLRSLMRHVIPSAEPAEIIDRALTIALDHVKKQKFALTPSPRQVKKRPESGRLIPAAVRRTVSSRDAGRCAFKGTDRRCDETAFLEFHHVVPFAAGGQATVENIELRCRAHNQHEATLFVGAATVRDQKN